MEGVKDRYLKHEPAGNQYVCCYAAGPDQLCKIFAVSPPYFDFTNLEDELEQTRLCKHIEKLLYLKIVEDGELIASSKILFGHKLLLFLTIMII